MTVVGVIPARFASTRFPGKPLVLIGGKPMIQRVWERASQARRLEEVIVATDDDRIASVCHELGMKVELTAKTHPTGTDRVAEVAKRVPAEVFVNIQGDEPLISPESIDACVACLQEARGMGIEVSTVYFEGASPDQEESRSCVHLVPTINGRVLMLSRLPIPCDFQEAFRRNIHVGLYAFTREALGRFTSRDRGPVERAESIELLRFLEYGDGVACRPILPGSMGVDHPEDVARVEALLGEAGRSG